MNMWKKFISILLSVALVLPLLPTSTYSADNSYKAEEIRSDYFYDQLNERAQAIYDKLLDEFSNKKEDYYSGTKIIDLMGLKKGDKEVISKEDVDAYVNSGNKDIFNDFCAAKDALDLDHSELWYIDSGYLTFQVTKDDSYHVLIGPGRGETYLLAGTKIDNVDKMTEDVNKAIDSITAEALKTLNDAEDRAGQVFSDQDRKAALITSVHDQIVRKIHYRYETECREINGVPHANAKYIRTIYGIVTHEGVCEAYARTLQVCLTKLGIECVLIHGVQSKGTPEDHMWNAVNIPEGEEDHWYVVDATWDDPLTANWDGTRDLEFNNGLDEKETNTYLMVGQSLVGEYWRPSGYVSTGNFEFTYPTIEVNAYSGSTMFGDDNGLKVKYSAGGSVEDGVPAGVYTATFKGMNAEAAAKKGFFFILKMYDYHPDGTADVMDEWYYANASLIVAGNTPYFGDYPDGLRFYSATCEYVEIAVTSRKPDHFEDWSTDPNTSYLSKHYEAGYYSGDESDIVASSGMLYNANSNYEAPPYVLTQSPAPNGNATAGYEYRFKVTYDDDLYHILPDDENARNGISTVADSDFADNYEAARTQPVQVRYTTNQQDLHSGGVKNIQVAGELPFDVNRDGIVDIESAYTDFRWIYKSDSVESGGHGVECPNKAYHEGGEKACSVEEGCPIVGVEFNFRASNQWIDDITEYNFSIQGVVGSRSRKFPNNFAVIAMVPGLCPACYRSQGIDWNLWGQPTLLDAPENLDLYGMAQSGGTDKDTLAALNEAMKTDDINGRLMLVVENKSEGSGNREEYEKIDGYLEDNGDVDGEILSSSVFEINFNRICPMVKLKPNAGQSLRVQVGYPAGITYEDLGSGKVELKAYHFTRCAENEPCDEYKNETEKEQREHKWGSHIIGVDEITIIPTPYGMVIMCDSFSPFEIVAVEKSDTAAAAIANDAEKASMVIVVSDSNGTVEYNNGTENVAAVGKDGNVEFKPGETKTFKVKPQDGYTVNTVSMDGQEIKVENGEFTVTAPENGIGVLNVTFVPETVKQAEEQEFGTAVVAKVCTHAKTTTVSDPEHTAKQATCTSDGYEPAVICEECGQTLSEARVIPATGHTIDMNNKDYYVKGKDPTCTENGARDFIKCIKCDTVISESGEIPALGHEFTDYTDVGEPTCQGQTKTATCNRCKVATETKVFSSGSVDHVFDQLVEKKEATCTEDAVETYKCKWCEERKQVAVEDSKTGHDYGEDGICKNCSAFACEGGHTLVDTDALAPTCTEDGHTAGKKCSVCGYWAQEEERVLATGHSFDGHVAGSKCTVCGEILQSDQHTPVEMEEIPATCTQEGRTGGIECAVCHDIIESPKVVPAKGHDWDESSAEWKWSTEGSVSASVILTCKTDSTHKETFAAVVSEPSVSKAPTCTETGTETRTATVTVGDLTITDTHSVVLPMIEHKFGTEPVKTVPATCTRHAEKIYECEVCHAQNTVVEEGELLPHEIVPDPLKSIPAGCTTKGLNVGTCVMCGAESSYETEPRGHSWNVEAPAWHWSEDGENEISASVTVSCPNCKEEQKPDVTIETDDTKEPTCTEEGSVTYTAKAAFEGTELSDTHVVTVAALGHDAKKVDAVEPTETENGNIDYWHCERCGKYFADEDLQNEITEDQTVVEATGTTTTPEPDVTPEPEVTEKPDVTPEPEVTEKPDVTPEPEVTEKPDASEEPEVTEKPDASEEPDASEKPEITAKPDNSSEPDNTGKPGSADNPQTDNNVRLDIWFALLAVSAFGLAIVTLAYKRRKNSER